MNPKGLLVIAIGFAVFSFGYFGTYHNITAILKKTIGKSLPENAGTGQNNGIAGSAPTVPTNQSSLVPGIPVI